ncbi:MAG: Penicillin-binding protein 2 [Alphaproteobacteria bacterium MarineAlpha6_Bin1]|nr:MAG: Penicillin-binding protein 2 [Alphaproteobacteria bacterium MarineAlpha6_Bin1]
MYKYPNLDKLLLRRTFLLGVGKGILLTGVLGRLIYLQIVKSNQYKLLANKNRISLRLLNPIRGIISDRNGKLLAINQNTFRVLCVVDNKIELKKALFNLSKFIFLNNIETQKIVNDFEKKNKNMPYLIKENLKWNEVSSISANSFLIPTIIIESGLQRKYPFKQTSAHTIGYLGPPTNNEIKKEPILGLMNINVGRFGMEEHLEKRLRGIPGTRHLEVNAHGRIVREIRKENSKKGNNVKLSIDIELQKKLYSLLKDKSGSIVAINVNNGEVIGMVSSPSFDPNFFNQGFSTEDWKTLINDPLAPLVNKSISGEYSPGSTFKTIVLLSALKNNIIKKNSSILCTSKLETKDRSFYCWCHKKKTGCYAARNHQRNVRPKLAIAQSCDCFFYELAKKVGINKIAETAKTFGIGKKTGIDIRGEKTGLVPTKSWKRKNIGKSWHVGETMITGVGQGYITSTPLQLALVTALIANNGKKIFPKINLDDFNLEKNVINDDMDEHHSDYEEYFPIIREGMYDAVNKHIGTAYKSRLSKPIFAGKTGTVQVRVITEEERETEIIPNRELPFEQRDHALFIGFAPYKNPKVAISIIIEHGGSGSSQAAPIAAKIFKKII